MSIFNINRFPGSDKLESKLPGVSFVGSDKLTEPTRAGIEEERTTMTRGQKAAATRKANRLKREQEAKREEELPSFMKSQSEIPDDFGPKQEAELRQATEAQADGAVHSVPPVGIPSPTEVDPSGLAPNQAGAKLDSGKVDMAQILGSFPRALFAVGTIGLFGAAKYSFEGWIQVDNGIHRYTSAGIRHLLKQFIEGPIDSDSKREHLSHEAWNALAKLELYLREKGETGEFEVKS